MKPMKSLLRAVAMLIVLTSFTVWAQVSPGIALPAHPRLLLPDADVMHLKADVDSDRTWTNVHNTLIKEADAMVGQEPQPYKLTGKYLLSVSREYLRRIFFLSYAFRMTDDTKYADQARSEMLAAAAMPDWHPSHFLDVAEMTTAMAIGYDWLYDRLSTAERNTCRQAIVDNGLRPSLEAASTKQFDTRTNNWNPVCHAAMVMGALAVWEQHRELATQIVNRAIEHVPLALAVYAPDGVYPEGSDYWDYGTNFCTLLLEVLEENFGSDFGLSQAEGFMNTGAYFMNMSAPSTHSFCYSDNGISSTSDVSPAIFWFFHKTGDASMLYSERVAMTRLGPARMKKNRLAPAAIIWGAKAVWNDIPTPASTFYLGQGRHAVAAMRSAWNNQRAMYLGVKLGTPSASHGHMDVGSFFIDSNHVTWATDLGSENYVTLDRHHISQWNMSQQSARWDVYRYNSNNHNLVTFDQQKQWVPGVAGIIDYSDTPDNMWVTADLTPLYPRQVKRYERTYALVDNNRCVITDRITADGTTTMWWNLMSAVNNATLVDDRTVKLEHNGKVMWLRIDTDMKIQWEITDATPATTYENKNKGVKAIRFHARLKGGSRHTVTATFSHTAPQ